MILRSLRFSSLGDSFAGQTVTMDFRDLPPGVYALIGANGCLVGNTMIDCPRDLGTYPQGIPMKDLVGTEPWVYAWKDGKIVVRKATRVWRTHRSAAVVRVLLEKYEPGVGAKPSRWTPPLELMGTPDHLVLLKNGKTWKALGDLQPGDRLCSMYRRASTSPSNPGGGESLIRWTGSGPVREHRFVATECYGPPPFPETHAHHKNANQLDQTPENIEWKSKHDHLSAHCSQRNLAGDFGWQAHGQHPRGMAGKQHSRAGKGRISRGLKRAYQERRRQYANHTVLSVESYGAESVYDITVPDADSFIANGVVVHNSGKTTALEAMLPGLLYRQFPSYRETVQQKATSRTTFLEGEFLAGGQSHKIVIQSDPQAGGAGRGKTEAYWYVNVAPKSGVYITEMAQAGLSSQQWEPKAGPLLADFDRYCAQWFPSLDLLLAGPMCAQKVVRGNGSFFSATPAERKELFVEALGLGQLEEQSKGYRARRLEIETRIGAMLEALADLKGGLSVDQFRGVVDSAAADVQQAQQTLEAAEYAVTAKSDALVQLKHAHEAYAAELKRLEGAHKQRREAVGTLVTERRAIDADGKRLQALVRARKHAPTEAEIALARAALAEIPAEVPAQLVASRQQRDRLVARQNALQPVAAALAGVDLSLEICQQCPLTQHALPATRELERLADEVPAAEAIVAVGEPIEAESRRLRAELDALEQRKADWAIPPDLDAQLEAWKARDAAAAQRETALQEPGAELERTIPPPPMDQVVREAHAATEAKTHARRGLDHAQKAHTEAETRLQAAVEAEARASELRASRGKLVADAAALKLLEDGLGKSGLQAVYCDQAGPPIESLTNHLLHETFGTEFSIGFETRRLKKGKKASDPDAYTEVFELRILNAWTNKELDQGSGGQTVWFDTAFRLALSIYVTQQTGKDLRTLCFDEPSGQLDPKRAPKFTDMLKAARVLGGFHHVFLVSHQREVWGACDGFFVFKGGRITYAGDIEAADALLEG